MRRPFPTLRPPLLETASDRGRRIRILRAALLALLLVFALPCPPAATAFAGDAPGGARTFEQRAAAEKKTRSRYRRLEVASLVLILACGGAAILWAVRRR
jgi:hypothetical protein